MVSSLVPTPPTSQKKCSMRCGSGCKAAEICWRYRDVVGTCYEERACRWESFCAMKVVVKMGRDIRITPYMGIFLQSTSVPNSSSSTCEDISPSPTATLTEEFTIHVTIKRCSSCRIQWKFKRHWYILLGGNIILSWGIFITWDIHLG